MIALPTTVPTSLTRLGVFGTRLTFCHETHPSSVGLRDTLEQIDVSRLLIEQYSEVTAEPDHLQTKIHIFQQTFQWAPTAKDIRDSISNGKIAGLLGVEGYVFIYPPPATLEHH